MARDSIVTDEIDQHDELVEEQLEVNNEEGEIEELLDPRAAKLAEIAANRSKEREQENGLEDNAEEGEELDESNTDSIKDEELPNESPIYQRDGQSYLKLKVNGQEVERTLDQVIAANQKHESADSRLNEAALENKRLHDRENQLNQREQQLNAQAEQPNAEQLSNQDAANRKELAAEHRQALYDGDEDKADELMIKMLDAGRQPATPHINVDQIAQDAEHRVVSRIQAEQYSAHIESINVTFEKDFSDVVEDENLYSMAKTFANNLIESHPDKPLEEVMKESGEHVRKWKKSIQTTASNESRHERKRSTIRTVSGINKSSSIGKDKPAPLTKSQIIANMRKGRPGAA